MSQLVAKYNTPIPLRMDKVQYSIFLNNLPKDILLSPSFHAFKTARLVFVQLVTVMSAWSVRIDVQKQFIFSVFIVEFR